jgi:hypothetical protein
VPHGLLLFTTCKISVISLARTCSKCLFSLEN